jgi:WD40 repeat protein
VACVAFDDSGTSIATGSLDGMVRIFELPAGRLRITCQGHTNWVSSLGFVPGGTRLVTASVDGTVRIWDTESGSELLVLRGHAGPVQAVAASPDGCGLVSGADDQTARLWGRSPAEITAARRSDPVSRSPRLPGSP